MRIMSAQYLYLGPSIVDEHLSAGPTASGWRRTKTAKIGRIKCDTRRGEAGRGILPRVAAVVHAMQRQHDGGWGLLRQPGAVWNGRFVRHDECAGGYGWRA